MSLTSKQIKAIKILDKKLLGRKPLCDHPADIQDLYQEALLYITTTNAPTTASTMCRNGIYAGQHAQEKFNRCGITYNTKPSWNSTSAELQRLPPISDCGYDYECANTNSTDGSPVIELTADLYVEDTVISNLDIKTAISTLPARTYPGSSKLSSPVSNIDPADIVTDLVEGYGKTEITKRVGTSKRSFVSRRESIRAHLAKYIK